MSVKTTGLIHLLIQYILNIGAQALTVWLNHTKMQIFIVQFWLNISKFIWFNLISAKIYGYSSK